MLVHAGIGNADRIPVESRFANSGFVAGNQQNSSAPQIEGERNAPDAAIAIESQLL